MSCRTTKQLYAKKHGYTFIDGSQDLDGKGLAQIASTLREPAEAAQHTCWTMLLLVLCLEIVSALLAVNFRASLVLSCLIEIGSLPTAIPLCASRLSVPLTVLPCRDGLAEVASPLTLVFNSCKK